MKIIESQDYQDYQTFFIFHSTSLDLRNMDFSFHLSPHHHRRAIPNFFLHSTAFSIGTHSGNDSQCLMFTQFSLQSERLLSSFSLIANMMRIARAIMKAARELSCAVLMLNRWNVDVFLSRISNLA